MQLTQADVNAIIVDGAVPLAVARLVAVAVGAVSANTERYPLKWPDGLRDEAADYLAEDTGLTVPYARKLIDAVLGARET